jgi:putative DNA primase/helicase
MKSIKKAMLNNGIKPPEEIIANGKIHRWFDDRGRKDLWYIVFSNGETQAGCFGDWSTGLKKFWKTDGNYSRLTDAQRLYFQVEMLRQEVIRKSEEKVRHQDAAAKASYIWNHSKPLTTYPYLSKKGIKAHCARLYKNALIIPIWNKNLLASLQFIDESGNKKMLTGGKLKGSSCNIGRYQSGNPILIVEGFATGASLFQSTGYLTVIAFSAGNLKEVAIDIRSSYPTSEIVICGDNDKTGVGQAAARAAALAISGKYIIPESVGYDFNDVLNREVSV